MSDTIKPLEPPDSIHLLAAEGWLGLGNPLDANEELEKIAPLLRAHPDVLTLRYEIYSRLAKWDGASEIAGALVKLCPEKPGVWIDLAYSTRRKTGGNIPQAKEILSEARVKFPKEYLVAYNLACYECQLGNRKAALQLMDEAIDLAGKTDIRLMALNDPDLESLWIDIAEI